jgi:1-acyl-sn-glycerol-3-phosphate acyltransferase
MPRVKSTRKPRSRATRRGAIHRVPDFAGAFAALDRELGAALDETSAAGATAVAARLVDWAGSLDWAAIVDRLDGIRGSERADEFGLDPEFEEAVAPLFTFLYRTWWGVVTHDVANVPASGPALVVANHAGAVFPWDGAMLKVALRFEHPAARELRPLVDDFVFKTPFLASLVARVGGVRACRENAERLLASDEVVAVFPEGIRGMRKPFRDRYQLQRFGRGGFVTLALATGVPIVPVAIVGAEETHPLLGTWRWPAKVLGVPYFPITPTFPWLGLLGLVPLPSKWSIRFGRPIDLARRYRPEDAADPVLVDRLVEDVRETVQVMVDQDRKARGNAF